MTYEARHRRGTNYALTAAVLLLSLLGFVAIGIIPTKSTEVGGTYPLVGWSIVIACFAAAFVFMRRTMDNSVQARIDGNGVYAKAHGPDPVAWDQITELLVLRAGHQRIARFYLTDGSALGINTTYYDRGMADLLAAVSHHRPDLVA